MEAIFLGTSSMVPTKERNQAGVFVSYGNEGLLLDCGEGTQRQMKIANISLTKITKIFLSHWHGDHVYGLVGVVSTLGSMDYQRTLNIYGPVGSNERFELLKKAYVFDERVGVEVIDVVDGVFLETEEFFMEARLLDHTTPCLGYSIVEKDKRKIKMDRAKKLGLSEGPLLGKLSAGESVNVGGKAINPDDVSTVHKGKKLTYITDTAICQAAIDLAKDSDVLICESTYDDGFEDKAEKNKHMTASQAGTVATQSNSKKLVLTHFSQRYKDLEKIEENVKTVFPNSFCASDFMKIRL